MRGVDADGVEVELGDQSWVKIRPIRQDDKRALRQAFERLSEESRYTRFLAPIERLTRSQLAYLTEVDHHDHEAVIALDGAGSGLVGVARFVREGGTSRAEAAVTVADDWQGRGLGMALTRILAGRALEEGIDTFTALLLSRNADMVGLLESVGAVDVVAREGETIQVVVPLSSEVKQDPALRSVLRAVAATGGEIASHPGRVER